MQQSASQIGRLLAVAIVCFAISACTAWSERSEINQQRLAQNAPGSNESSGYGGMNSSRGSTNPESWGSIYSNPGGANLQTYDGGSARGSSGIHGNGLPGDP